MAHRRCPSEGANRRVPIGGCQSEGASRRVPVGGCQSEGANRVPVGGCQSAVSVGGCQSAVPVGGCQSAVSGTEKQSARDVKGRGGGGSRASSAGRRPRMSEHRTPHPCGPIRRWRFFLHRSVAATQALRARRPRLVTCRPMPPRGRGFGRHARSFGRRTQGCPASAALVTSLASAFGGARVRATICALDSP